MQLTPRDSGVDLARTVAISGVLLIHTMGIGFGRFGVQLFFLISGYLLANYWRYETRLAFLLHRIVRLFPLSIIFFILFSQNQGIKVGVLHSRDDFDFINLTLLANVHWSFDQIPGGWSISNEWLYSILLILLGLLTKQKLYFLLFWSLSLQLVTGFWVWTQGGVSLEDPETSQYFIWINTLNPFINLSFFLIGIILQIQKKWVSLPSSILFVFLLVSICVDNFVGHLLIIWNFGVLAVFLLCLRVGLSRNSRKVVHFIGKRTYGTFLSHFIVMQYASNLLTDFTSFDGITYKLTFLVLTFIGSLICGSITWLLIESPSLKLYKKISGSK